MKKQILILVLAIFAIGFTSTAFGQNLGGVPICPDPTPLDATCNTTNGLAPIPGVEYPYTVEVPSPTTGTKSFTWFVTQDQNFITAGAITAAAEANDGTGAHIFQTGTGYNNPTTGTASIDITWKYWAHDPDHPVFLVIYVENDECPTDNIKVYIIIPRHSFTLDIVNIAEDGSAQANDYATCVSPVASASYNVATGQVLMDYGINYMYFAVTAANFTHSWLPSFQTGGAGLANSRTVAVHTASPADAQAGIWFAMTETAAGSNLWTTTTPVNATGGSVGGEGQCLIVRVTVSNNQSETLVDAPISLAVDGIMYDPANSNYANTDLGDLHHGNCTIDGFTNDIVTQVLSPRPRINDLTPPATDDFVPTNSQP